MWYVQLDERTLKRLGKSVRQKEITGFDLTRNSFRGGQGARFAIDVLKHNRSVAEFCWEDNSFHSTDDACKLVEVVLEHPTISNLLLKGSLNEITVPYIPVKRLFGGVGNATLLRVNLYNNGIKTNGDRSIPEFLSTNPPLEYLDLDENRLTDDDALHIAQALQSNTNLRYLDLHDNALTEEGKRDAYRLSVFGLNHSDLTGVVAHWNLNFNVVSGANHTCEIMGVVGHNNDSIMNGDNLSSIKFMNNGEEPAKWNRSAKLFELLVNRHCSVCNMTQIESEFSEDGIELVPHVLACVNTYASNRFRVVAQFVAPFGAGARLENARDVSVPPCLAQASRDESQTQLAIWTQQHAA